MVYLKIADVCQLLNKTKYPATKTVNGVTFTNNGDGSFTVNGTATADVNLSLGTFSIVNGNVLLFAGCPTGGTNATYYMWDNGTLQRDTGSGILYTNIRTSSYPQIRIKKDYTANNLVFKPQLIDLTVTYGAGNEPTTVEEFRAKFPEEFYVYSPKCWVKSL